MTRGPFIHTHILKGEDRDPSLLHVQLERVVHLPDGTVKGYIHRSYGLPSYAPFYVPKAEDRTRLSSGEDTLHRAIEWVVER